MSTNNPQPVNPSVADDHSSAAKKPPAYSKQGGWNNKAARWKIGVLVLLAMALAVFGWWFFFLRGIVYSDDARFNGHLVDVGAEIGGRVQEVLVREGNRARQGQLVFTLDTRMQRATVTQDEAAVTTAQANLAVAQAQCERAVNGPRSQEIRSAEALVLKLRSDHTLADLELKRIQALRQEGAGTPEQLDQARSASEAALQNLASAEQNLALLREGTRKEDLAVAKATVTLAQGRLAEATATLAKAREDLGRCEIHAPFDGFVVRRWLDPGAMVAAGQPVISMFDPTTLRVDVNIEEKYLGDVALGDDVDIEVDSYPDLRLKGRVRDILRAVNAEFSMVPAEGVSGTFIKVTQRVPLRISVEAPADLAIGPGLSVEVRIHSGSAARRQASTSHP